MAVGLPPPGNDWAPPDPATHGVSARPPRPPKVPFLRRPHKKIFWQSFFVLFLLDGAWAYYRVSSSQSELEAEGNEFAGLVWVALPIRMAIDSVVIALLAGAVVLLGAVAKSR